jgi:hypothetical protein
MIQQKRHIDLTDYSDIITEQPMTRQVTDEDPGHAKMVEPAVEAPKKKSVFREIFDGTFLVRENVTRQLPYLLFLTLLGVIYIGNRFHAERMVRQVDELKVEVGNLRSEQITITSELMNISRPSEVAALVESKGLGLKESLEPPKKLRK